VKPKDRLGDLGSKQIVGLPTGLWSNGSETSWFPVLPVTAVILLFPEAARLGPGTVAVPRV
jgi:hypothetical protein